MEEFHAGTKNQFLNFLKDVFDLANTTWSQRMTQKCCLFAELRSWEVKGHVVYVFRVPAGMAPYFRRYDTTTT